ncbi:MAG: uracil-DNA glycosylase [Campylobacterota bacterium]|nr:uracil-DNA glycosylase [Campylobacterota bacterium]
MNIEIFLNKLQKRANKSGTNNPYKNEKVLNNLRVYLNILKEQYYNGVMLVAEAPGYSGCNITGIPFTTVKILNEKPHEIFNKLDDELFKGELFSDISGAVIWDYLKDKEKLPLFWNSFPFHPYKRYKKFSNRKPTESELKEGIGYIDDLIELFNPSQILSLGRYGQISLQKIYPDQKIEYIRHPSYGGKKDFIEGMDRFIYNV